MKSARFSLTILRHGDGMQFSDMPPSASSRLGGMTATLLICLAILSLGFLQLTAPSFTTTKSAALTLIEIAPPRAVPVKPNEKPPGPEQQSIPVPALPKVMAIAPAHALTPIPMLLRAAPSVHAEQVIGLPASAASSISNPALSSAPPTAPEHRNAPQADIASEARPKWEALLLAAINRVKRYPNEASRKHQQGTVKIRFVVDRRGRVFSVNLVQSSGFPSLDAEALSLPRRAAPLPRPPAQLASQHIELTVPIEFFVK